MPSTKNYYCTDIEMITVSGIIAQSFQANITDLSAVRTNWTSKYAEELIARVNDIGKRYVSLDTQKDQRAATASLHDIQEAAKRDVSFFKKQLEEDFKADPAFIAETLKTLSIDKYIRDVQKDNQEALSALLIGFANGITPTLRAAITAKGMNSALIDKIVAHATTFQSANVSQEQQKSTTKSISKEATDALNGVYDEIIAICKIAAGYYQDNELLKKQFTFSHVLSQLGGGSKPNTPPAAPDQPTK